MQAETTRGGTAAGKLQEQWFIPRSKNEQGKIYKHCTIGTKGDYFLPHKTVLKFMGKSNFWQYGVGGFSLIKIAVDGLFAFQTAIFALPFRYF